MSTKVAGTKHWDKYAKGVPTDLSDEQRELVKSFLAKCPAEQVESMRFTCEPAEYFACRVLRARKFVVEDALSLVKETTAWRKEMNVPALRGKNPFELLGGTTEDELQFFYQKSYFTTRDRDMRPVYVERGGVVDVDAMFMLTNIEHLVDYHIYANEAGMIPLFEQASVEAGRPITTLCAIIDMRDMSTKLSTSATISYITRMINIDSKHYPETLGRMFIINVPTIFSVAWALIRPFLDERTQNKIEIFSSETEWKKRIVTIIDADKLPIEYGGTLDAPVFPPSRTKKETINAGKEFIVATTPIPAGSDVTFKWFSRPGDMGFGVNFKPTGGASTVVTAAKDFPMSEKVIIKLTLTQQVEGVYELVWNNSKGWWARDLFYRWDITVKGEPVGVK